MRADRLVATLLLMQTRGRVTAAELAAELEISVATARRDLEALSAAGVPVYPQPGRHGGWSLVGGARTDLTGLTAAEARALFLLAGPVAASAPARSALRKLAGALPAPFRADAEAAATATHIDPAGWGDHDRPRPAIVDRLQDAVVQHHRIRFAYRSPDRRPDDPGRPRDDGPGTGPPGGAGRLREADPWGLVDKDDVWYLVAGTDAGRRTFRVDRIGALEITGETFARPAGFDLATAWTAVAAEVEQKRATTQATVLIPERFVWVLRDHFGTHCEPLDVLPDGRARVRLGAPTARDMARALSGWGATVEVVDPPEVRAELARIGAELTTLYRPRARD